MDSETEFVRRDPDSSSSSSSLSSSGSLSSSSDPGSTIEDLF